MYLNKYKDKKDISSATIDSDRPSFMTNIKSPDFYEIINKLHKDNLIDTSGETPYYSINYKGQKYLRSISSTNKTLMEVSKCFPEIEINQRLKAVEAFIFGFVLTTFSIVTILLFNEKIKNITPLTSLLGSCIMIGGSLMFVAFFMISGTMLKKIGFGLLITIVDFFEDNKSWIGYVIAVVIVFSSLYVMYKFLGFTNQMLIGSAIFSFVWFILSKTKKINDFVKSLSMQKLMDKKGKEK